MQIIADNNCTKTNAEYNSRLAQTKRSFAQCLTSKTMAWHCIEFFIQYLTEPTSFVPSIDLQLQLFASEDTDPNQSYCGEYEIIVGVTTTTNPISIPNFEHKSTEKWSEFWISVLSTFECLVSSRMSMIARIQFRRIKCQSTIHRIDLRL